MPISHTLRGIQAPVFPLMAGQHNSLQPSVMPAGIIVLGPKVRKESLFFNVFCRLLCNTNLLCRSLVPDARPVPYKARRSGSFLADAAVTAALLAILSITMSRLVHSNPTTPAILNGSISPEFLLHKGPLNKSALPRHPPISKKNRILTENQQLEASFRH
ncbi:hypothetical protein ACQKWADRAFT_289597 [Trichoderma austrokoningii]